MTQNDPGKLIVSKMGLKYTISLVRYGTTCRSAPTQWYRSGDALTSPARQNLSKHKLGKAPGSGFVRVAGCNWQALVKKNPPPKKKKKNTVDLSAHESNIVVRHEPVKAREHRRRRGLGRVCRRKVPDGPGVVQRVVHPGADALCRGIDHVHGPCARAGGVERPYACGPGLPSGCSPMAVGALVSVRWQTFHRAAAFAA